MRLVCISDTHGLHDVRVPDGDVLVHAGDLTASGSLEQIAEAHAWLASLPHEHKLVIAGNHDWAFERTPAEARALMTGVTYLEDAACEVRGVRFYGSPWQPRFFDWAFNLDRGPALAAVWAKIPDDTDVLITHGPPHGILDTVHSGREVGCEALRDALPRIRPRVHVFGHIHEAHGEVVRDGTHFVNASTCTLRYEPLQPPIVVDL